MQFFKLLALPALAIAAAVPNAAPEAVNSRQLPPLTNLPLDPTCVTTCLLGVTACTPTNLASLAGLVGCPVSVILCAVGCITGLVPVPTTPGVGSLLPGLPIIAKE